MKKLKAFTLIEILLAMAIVGIIAGATASQLKRMDADKIKMQFKTNYANLNKILHSMLDDPALCPDPEKGFTKMNTAFAKAVYDLMEEPKKDSYSGSSDGISYYINTGNGSYWEVSPYTLRGGGVLNTINHSTPIKLVYIDVNGESEGPNCPVDSKGGSWGTATYYSTSCPKPDRFLFGIAYDGHIIFDEQEKYNGKKMYNYLKDSGYLTK